MIFQHSWLGSCSLSIVRSQSRITRPIDFNSLNWIRNYNFQEDSNSDSSDEDVPAEREREKNTEEEDLSTMDMPCVYCAKLCKGLRGLTQHGTHCKVFNKSNKLSWRLFLFHRRRVLITKMNTLILKPSLFRLWLILGCNKCLVTQARVFPGHRRKGTNAVFSMKYVRSGDDGENVCIVDIVQSFYFLLRISSYF